MAEPTDESWDRYQKLVLYKLDFLNVNLTEVIKKQNTIEREIAKMKAVASAFGFGGGILVTIVTWLIDYSQKH